MSAVLKKSKKTAAFTIVELLTVMSVIIILIGLLVPALTRVKRYAKRVTQKNQFHSISVALDFFNAEHESYPDSVALTTNSVVTTGAHRLAEALVGRDQQGFDPWSSWNAQADISAPIYGQGTPAQQDASYQRRTGPYLGRKNVGVFQIAQLYENYGNVYPGSHNTSGISTGRPPAPVLTDVYRVKTARLRTGQDTYTVVKAGTPILYYRADVFSKIFDYRYPRDSIINIKDNEDLIGLDRMMEQAEQHPFDQDYIDPLTGKPGRQLFYEKITNPQLTNQNLPVSQRYRPYNQDSYILISAGFDGFFGPRPGVFYDDVFNFGN